MPGAEPPPLVSCIMPTYNRRAFVPRAVDCFLRQDYPAKELIVVDDGSDPVGDLMPPDGRIRYVRLPNRATVGAKRNLACERAGGTIIAHWDDDDWHAPHRLTYQAGALLRAGADLCGLNAFLFYEPSTGRAWQYVYPSHQRHCLAGSTLCYTRDFWNRTRFANVDVGEDIRFAQSCPPARLLALPDPTFHVGIIHRHNVSPKQTAGVHWRSFPAEEIRRLLGADWAYYATSDAEPAWGNGALAATPSPRSVITIGGRTASTTDGSDERGGGPTCLPRRGPISSDLDIERENLDIEREKRSIAVITIARASDLTLPEFVACNQSDATKRESPLPWMRRWELPFALFQARLPDCAAVLDCTINPVGFHARLTRLYPHTLYRHWSPIQNGHFVLPLGVPDGSFDRVVCINTLEHLLRQQRVALIAALARKLKPGGLLILTSDYYFDGAWDQPAFLNAGVMRRDRQEIFNGWNRVTPDEWLSACHAAGLLPLADAVGVAEPGGDGETRLEPPREDDPTLYRSQHAYPHASIGGVFFRPPAPSIPPGKKVMLALLTWNTRDISVESLRAHLREAWTLRRLGHQPSICVCDNGSTDGTPEEIRALEPELDVPYRLIFNDRNLGNSIARNQIIDHARAADADYILFVDGDIEVVPFSSVAMLRYMEGNGHQLGCIGADSVGQTPHRERASACFYAVDPGAIETTSLVAWTQYGMFRRAVFDDGVRFDETEPFDRAGWGFEDNDLAFQMHLKGYVNQRFFGMIYLHRNARSSIRIMRERGIDAAALYARRKQYVIDKWAPVPQINAGPLVDVRRVTMPF